MLLYFKNKNELGGNFMENTRKIETKSLTKMAILAALIFFGTYFIKIPGINGYTHFGDCMIFIAVLIVGTKKGALSAAVGASLADLLGGYAQWIIPTFFIKAIMATIIISPVLLHILPTH